MSVFELRRQKRKTLTIKIQGGKVIVLAPLKKPAAEIDRFIEQKTNWIEKKLAEYRKKQGKYEDVISYKVALIEGQKYGVALSERVKKPAIVGSDLLLPLRCAEPAQWEKAIGAFIKKAAHSALAARLDAVSSQIGLPYGEFSLTNAKGKWGSCDGQNNIMLNWRLYMLPPHILTYVIVHELCHTKEHNHSPKFWAEVELRLPEYKRIKKELKECSVINELFR